MPTLKEFVNDVLAQNNLQSDADQIIKLITDIAKERAVDNVAAISDDEVRDMVINNADLANRLVAEKKAKEEAAAQRKAEEEAKKEAEKLQKKLEKERKLADGVQMSLGLFGEKQ